MGISNAIKLVLLLVLFGITTALAIEFASSPDSNDETLSRNVSSPEGGERSLLERMLRGRRHRGRRPRGRRGPRQPRPLPRVGRPRAGRRRARRAPVIVAQDGSGNFRTIKEALDASRRRKGLGRFVIHIKAGVYREILVVEVGMKNIKFIGDGIGRTIITGSNFHNRVRGTEASATVLIEGDAFVARDLTFQNTYALAQAPAITITAPTSAFYRVGFDGFHDTVYVKQGKQFFKECDVYGTVDFICGNGASIFQNSKIIARKSPDGGNTITISASNRNLPNEPTGLVFQNCQLTATPELRAVLFGPDLAASSRMHIYLGRPWQEYSRTIFMTCVFDLPIHAEGWLEWERRRDGGPKVYYREFSNRGLGSGTGGRVKWAGYRVMTDRNEANQFTVANFIQGLTWLPKTGVPFYAGL